MIKVLTGSQMRSIDKKAIEDLNIPGLILMENAGGAVYEQVLEIIESSKDEYSSVLILCGKGNNGGDGFVAARHLIQNNIQTTVVSLYEEDCLSGDALTNHNILKNFSDIAYLEEIGLDQLKEMISSSSIVVDAILGTGLSSEVKGQIKDVIDAVNEYSEGYVVSVDIPSGIDANTGKVLGSAILADYTITFFAPKLGSVLYPGGEHSGEVIISDIGIPELLINDSEYNIQLISSHHAGLLLPIRAENSHKGTFGSVFTIAGSLGLSGAAYMSSSSALNIGAGYSILAAPESLIPVLSSMSPEVIHVALPETPTKAISCDAISNALDKSKNCNIFLLGPGLGTDPSTVKFVSGITQELVDRGSSCILDADALNCLAIQKDFVLPLNSVITPHPKELSRLMNISVEEVLEDKVKAARDASRQFNTIVVLKGARTIIAEPDGRAYINLTGNSGLATAGTGDILSGMIAGLAAQGMSLKDASILGIYLHGLAGDFAAKELTEYCLKATDLWNYLPDAIKTLQEL